MVWHVPGSNPIAGEHWGFAGVAAYFERRRRLARATMRMRPGAALVSGEAVARFVDGEAELGEERVSWKMIGVDRLWSAAGSS